MFLYIVGFIVGLIGLVFTFLQVTAPKIKYSKVTDKENPNGRGQILVEYQKVPGALEFYIRMLTSPNNWTKSNSLPANKQAPKCEIFVAQEGIDKPSFRKYLKICGYATDSTTVPAPYHIGVSLPVVSGILTHPAWPIKPMATLIHIKQTLSLLRAIKVDEKFYKRAVLTGVKNTERGTEMDAVVQLFSSADYSEQSIVMQGVASLLILKKRGGAKEQEEAKVPETKKFEVKIPPNTGRMYAAASGDYNPWHLSGVSAKIFGFKKAICHGMWSYAKTLALIQDDIPAYPLHFEAEWKKPMFMPGTAQVLEFVSSDKKNVGFEMWSGDMQHLHMKGFVRHEPNLKFSKPNA